MHLNFLILFFKNMPTLIAYAILWSGLWYNYGICMAYGMTFGIIFENI